MILRKLVNSDTLQVFSIKNCSKLFRSRFPKKFIGSVVSNERLYIFNEDSLPNIFWWSSPTGYIFTYLTHVPKNLGSNVARLKEIGFTQPRGLDTFFIGNSDNFINVIMNCVLREIKIAPVHWIKNMVIRGNLEDLCDCSTSDILKSYSQKKFDIAKSLSKSVIKIINENYSIEKVVEKWVLEVIHNTPLNSLGYPNKYPKTISERSLSKVSEIRLNQLFVEYDVRVLNKVNNVHKIENVYINLIEDAFEKDRIVTIYNTFNNKLPEIRKVAKRKKIKIKDDIPDYIKMKFYDFRSLGITYDLKN
jgi:hypothetical protein